MYSAQTVQGRVRRDPGGESSEPPETRARAPRSAHRAQPDVVGAQDKLAVGHAVEVAERDGARVARVEQARVELVALAERRAQPCVV